MIETGLVGLLGDLADVYPWVVPQSATLPAITYARVSTNSSQTHDGPSGIDLVRLQFTVHADTHVGALNIADSIRTRLDGYSGTLGGVTVPNVEFTNLLDEGRDPDTGSWTVIVEVIAYEYY